MVSQASSAMKSAINRLMYKIRIENSVTAIDPEAWDALAKERFYMSYGWLKSIEETAIDRVTPLYFVLERGDELLATAACYESHRDNPYDLLNGFMLGRLERLAGMFGLAFKPAFLCGPLRGAGEHVMVKGGLSGDESLSSLREMLDAIETEATRRGLPLFFTNVSELEADLRKEFRSRGYNVTKVHPKNRLDIKWASFEEYMADRGTIVRKNYETFRHEIKRNRMAGVTFRELEQVEQEERLYQLVSDHHYRLNLQPFPYASNFFSVLKSNLGRDARILVAEKAGQIVGVVTLFHRGTSGWTTFIGLDYEATRNDFTYFVLAYCKAIECGINAGMKRIDYGSMLYRVKKRRGCTVTQSFIYHKACSGMAHALLRPWFLFHRLWYEKRKIPGLLSG